MRLDYNKIMKKKKKENNRKIHDNISRVYPYNRKVWSFFHALCVCVLIGMIVILLLKMHQSGKMIFWKNTTTVWSSNALTDNDAKIAAQWESIPSEEISIEETGTESVTAPGTLTKNEYGKILTEQLDENEEVSFLFAGDVLLDDSYTPMYTLKQRENGILDCFSEDTLEMMQDADVFMLNNEFPYTTEGEPLPNKEYTFRANPENVSLLDQIGVDIVSLANNHAYDYGEISLLDSLDTLNTDEMAYVGAGHDLEEASQPVVFQNDEMSVSIIAATQIERLDNPDTKGATEDAPGVFRCWQSNDLLEAVKQSKAAGNYTIVYIHWGTESTSEVDSYQEELAQQLVENGADLIMGDHPHVLQSITQIDGVPIIYSLGNYWFNSSTCETCLIKVTLKDGKLESYQFIPAIQSDCYTKILSGEEQDEAIQNMSTLSPGVTIDEKGYVTF